MFTIHPADNTMRSTRVTYKPVGKACLTSDHSLSFETWQHGENRRMPKGNHSLGEDIVESNDFGLKHIH